MKERKNCTIRVAKTKAMISCAVVFASAKIWLSHAVAQLYLGLHLTLESCMIRDTKSLL